MDPSGRRRRLRENGDARRDGKHFRIRIEGLKTAKDIDINPIVANNRLTDDLWGLGRTVPAPSPTALEEAGDEGLELQNALL
jgi:hypothetical protein